MANKKLGIHIAPGALKIVEVEQQDKGLKVLNCSIDYFPPESSMDFQSKALISALKKSRISVKEANLVISGADVVYKLIEMPELSEKDLASAITYKLKASLPAAFGEFVSDYYKIEKLQGKENKHLYFVTAAPAEKISAISGIIKAAGLSLKDIIAPSCALKNAAGGAVPDPGAIIYLGKYSSLIILVKDGQVVFAREVKIGGNDITQAMVGVVQTEKERLELDLSHAEEIKNKYGIPANLEQYSGEAGVPAAELMAMMRPALEKFSTEILNTFDYYRREIGDETGFKKIYFTGGLSTTRNLLPYFKDQTGLEIEALPAAADSIKKEFTETFPFYALALGAVVRGKDHLSLLPRKGEEYLWKGLQAMLVEGIKKRLKYVFMAAAYLLMLFLVFNWFNLQQKKLAAEQQNLQKKYQEQAVKSGKEAEAAKGIMDLIKYSERDRFTLIMQELDKIIPAAVYLQYLNYDNNTGELIVKGIVLEDGGKTSMANFMEKLNGSRYFKMVDLIYLQESKTYTVPTYEFEIKCLLIGT
jgi:Tfp pilus assembly PilM family ATPase/Tfp pilus assembly protein PilN